MAISSQGKIVITNEKEFEERKKKVCKQLENLKKQASKGKIGETISSKLKKELEEELEKIENELSERLKRESAEIQAELDVMQTKTSELESKQKELSTQEEELEARFAIKQIDRRDYNDKRRIYTQQIEQINRDIDLNKIRIGKLDARLKSVTQVLESKQNRPTTIQPDS
jgi:chromosome segregation ATPase